LCGSGGGLLIGIDLRKDVATIEAAYNDRQGVTSEFNLNLLRRINDQLDGDFDLACFQHVAVYDRTHGRVEIGLVSQRRQRVTVSGEEFQFHKGDTIRTEYSHKYTVAGFAEIAAAANLKLRRYWTDEREMFGVLHLAVASPRVHG
jgi:uncharacterized SAM-dependent methyltransferase